MYNKDFGKKLAELRSKAGYDSQRQFALAVGISSPSISRIESGIQEAEPETLEKFAPVLKVSYDELMRTAGYLPPVSDEEFQKACRGVEQTSLSFKLELKGEEIVQLAHSLQDLSEEDLKMVESLINHLKIKKQNNIDGR